jgi:hypothetical protein
MFYRNVIKTTSQIYGIQHLNLWFFLQKYLHFSLILEMCIYKCPQSPKTPTIGQSPSHYQHEQQNQTQ